MPIEQTIQALQRGLRPRSALGQVFTRAAAMHMASQRQALASNAAQTRNSAMQLAAGE